MISHNSYKQTTKQDSVVEELAFPIVSCFAEEFRNTNSNKEQRQTYIPDKCEYTEQRCFERCRRQSFVLQTHHTLRTLGVGEEQVDEFAEGTADCGRTYIDKYHTNMCVHEHLDSLHMESGGKRVG